MLHQLPRIWIHAIWSTKNRASLIEPAFEKSIHLYLSSRFEEAGCQVRIINGMPDHVHCLYQQNPLKSVAEVIKYVKSGSSYWINAQEMIPGRFAWQKGYAAFSLEHTGLEWIHHYIAEQKKQHLQKSFREEFNQFVRMHGLNENSPSVRLLSTRKDLLQFSR